MARLIILNGPPAAGKSTLSELFVADHRLALRLDIDLVRSLLGGWDEHASTAGRQARRLAVVMATEHLRSGYDVVIPQLLAREEFLAELAELSDRVGAQHHEFYLEISESLMLSRFAARLATADRVEHRAGAALDRRDRTAELVDYYRRLVRLVAGRPQVLTLDASGTPEATYRQLRTALGEQSGMIGSR